MAEMADLCVSPHASSQAASTGSLASNSVSNDPTHNGAVSDFRNYDAYADQWAIIQLFMYMATDGRAAGGGAPRSSASCRVRAWHRSARWCTAPHHFFKKGIRALVCADSNWVLSPQGVGNRAQRTSRTKPRGEAGGSRQALRSAKACDGVDHRSRVQRENRRRGHSRGVMPADGARSLQQSPSPRGAHVRQQAACMYLRGRRRSQGTQKGRARQLQLPPVGALCQVRRRDVCWMR
jgi:hypothetical protein